MAAVAAAAALVAAGTGYGLTTALGGSSSPRRTVPDAGGSTPARGTAAGLTSVDGCAGVYVAGGSLERVSGTRLILRPQMRTMPPAPRSVTVTTSPSTAITRPVNGTVSDITDGSQVSVVGAWSGRTLAATQVGINAALPSTSSVPTSSVKPPIPHYAHGHKSPRKLLPDPVAIGTVVDLHDGSFTVVAPHAAPVPVITSNSTKILTMVGTSLSRLDRGADVVAVGKIGPDGVLTASMVAEPSVLIPLLGGPVKVPPSGCSASVITTAILAGS